MRALEAVEQEALVQAAAVGDHLLRRGLGPYTDWIDGATGEGMVLLHLAQVAQEERFLAGAKRWGDWPADVAIRAADLAVVCCAPCWQGDGP